MREIVLDTETTGLDPYQGHRLVEIGCIELVNRFPSGQSFHRYLNPERDVPAEAFAVHGLSAEFLKDKPALPRWWTSCWRSSATLRWSRITRFSISAFSTPSSSDAARRWSRASGWSTPCCWRGASIRPAESPR